MQVAVPRRHAVKRANCDIPGRSGSPALCYSHRSAAGQPESCTVVGEAIQMAIGSSTRYYSELVELGD